MKISAQKKLRLKPRQAEVVSEEIENFVIDRIIIYLQKNNNMILCKFQEKRRLGVSSGTRIFSESTVLLEFTFGTKAFSVIVTPKFF